MSKPASAYEMRLSVIPWAFACFCSRASWLAKKGAPSTRPVIRAGPMAAPSIVTHLTESARKPASLASSGNRIPWLLPGVIESVLPSRSFGALMPEPSRTKIECGGRRK